MPWLREMRHRRLCVCVCCLSSYWRHLGIWNDDDVVGVGFVCAYKTYELIRHSCWGWGNVLFCDVRFIYLNWINNEDIVLCNWLQGEKLCALLDIIVRIIKRARRNLVVDTSINSMSFLCNLLNYFSFYLLIF